MKNYDIFLTNLNKNSLLYTSCIKRRYLAAIIDFIVLGAILLTIGVSGESPLAGITNLSLVAIILLLPEIYWRQTLGMFICNVVVLVPPNSHPIRSIVIRKLMHFVEFFLPSLVYYFFVSFTKNNQSLGDMASSCIVVRKRYLFQKPTTVKKLSTFTKISTPLVFFLTPLLSFLILPILFIFFVRGIL